MTSNRQKQDSINPVIDGGKSNLEKNEKCQQVRIRHGNDAAAGASDSDRSSSAVDALVGVQSSFNSIGLNSRATAIEQCVQAELRRYFDMLDGEDPSNLYRMVIRQAEQAVIDMVMTECRGNQTRAAEWLGISRGNLRTKLANMNK